MKTFLMLSIAANVVSADLMLNIGTWWSYIIMKINLICVGVALYELTKHKWN